MGYIIISSNLNWNYEYSYLKNQTNSQIHTHTGLKFKFKIGEHMTGNAALGIKIILNQSRLNL